MHAWNTQELPRKAGLKARRHARQTRLLQGAGALSLSILLLQMTAAYAHPTCTHKRTQGTAAQGGATWWLSLQQVHQPCPEGAYGYRAHRQRPFGGRHNTALVDTQC